MKVHAKPVDYLAIYACGLGLFSTSAAVSVLDSSGALDTCTDVIGSSSGSIIALAYTLGVPVSTLHSLASASAVSTVSDLVRQPLGFITRRSVLPDTHKRALIKSLLELRGLGEHTTFRQLHESCTGPALHVCITTAPQTSGSHTILCSHRLTPSMRVLECVHASSQVPYIFPRMLYTGPDLALPNQLLRTNDTVVDGGVLSPVTVPFHLRIDTAKSGCHILCQDDPLDYDAVFPEEMFMSSVPLQNRLAVPKSPAEMPAAIRRARQWASTPWVDRPRRSTYHKGVLFAHGGQAIATDRLADWVDAGLVVGVGESAAAAFRWYARRFYPVVYTPEVTFGDLPGTGFVVATRNATTNSTVEFSKTCTPTVRIADTFTSMDGMHTYRGATVQNPYTGTTMLNPGDVLCNRMDRVSPLWSPPYYLPIHLAFACVEVLVVRVQPTGLGTIFYNNNKGFDYADHPGITTWVV